MSQPILVRSRVRINEHERFGIGGDVPHRFAQIFDFLTGSGGGGSDD